MAKNQKYHLAQLNIGKTVGDMESPEMEVFANNLDPINAIAESSEGFVWRLKDESGNATNITPYEDPHIIVNMSVWESVEDLKNFMFRTHHAEFLGRRKEWFVPMAEATYVLWWIPVGTTPTIEEAKAKLERLNEIGESQEAFSFKRVFGPPK